MDEYGEKQRTHLREKYTAVLAMRFALETDLSPGIGGAYCVWDKKHKLNEIDIDPNYLLKGNEGRSPFHRVLHAWQLANLGLPLLHVDIHGKMDRKDSYDLDLGVACLHKHWLHEEPEFVNAFIGRLTSGFNKVLASIPKYKEYKAVCNNDPDLHGNWGGDLRTMTE